jgi:ribosomal protein S6
MTQEGDQESKVPPTVYEVGYLVSSVVPEEKVAEEAGNVRSTIEKSGSYVISEDMPRLKQLAYTIEKSVGGKNERHVSAYFGNIKFEVSRDSVAEIAKNLEANKTIIRFILLKVPREIPVAHKPMFRSRTEKPKTADSETGDKEAPAKVTMTEAELDKTIEGLIVE